MIHWFDDPMPATNTKDGFEVLVHGLQERGDFTVDALCVIEEGDLRRFPMTDIRLEWRYTRGRGWHGLAPLEPDEKD